MGGIQQTRFDIMGKSRSLSFRDRIRSFGNFHFLSIPESSNNCFELRNSQRNPARKTRAALFWIYDTELAANLSRLSGPIISSEARLYFTAKISTIERQFIGGDTSRRSPAH